MHVNTMRAVLTGARLYHRRVSLGIFSVKAIRVLFRSVLKLLMGLQMSILFGEKNYFGNINWEHLHLTVSMIEQLMLNWVFLHVERPNVIIF